MLAILDDQAVMIHGHFVKGFKQVVCYENANKMSKRILTSKRQNAIWCHQNQLCFVHIFLILVCCTIGTRKGISYRAYDEEMSKPLLVLTLLKIISDINGISVYRFLYSNRWYINNISKAVALKVLISRRIVLTITKGVVAI